jgi:DNA primase large subunit
VQTSRLARYPYSPEATEYVRASGPDLESALGDPIYRRALDRAIERLEQAIRTGRVSVRATSLTADDHSEIVSYAIARILVSALGDRSLIAWFSRAEAARLAHVLSKAEVDTTVETARELGIPLEGSGDRIAVHFSDYVLAAPRDGPGKLVNQRLERGRVIFSRRELEQSSRRMREVAEVEDEESQRGKKHKHPGWQKEKVENVRPYATLVQLAERALELRIADELPLAIPPELVAAVAPKLARVKLAMDERRKREKEQYGEVRQELFPPCMKHLLGDLQGGVNVPHLGRFSVTAFLSEIGMDPDEIMVLYARTRDFRADLTRYQVEHITGRTSGTKYTPPNCATMLTYNLCCQRVKEVECNDHRRDPRCQESWLRHPLTYYRSRIRYEKKKGRSPGAATEPKPEGTAS